MKRGIYLSLLIMTFNTAVSQKKLTDGVYLVDKLSVDSYRSKYENKALITHNVSFIEEAPEEYNPVLVNTDDFVPFKLSRLPITEKDRQHNKILILKLTENESVKLKALTKKNVKRYVVLDGQALTVHRIKQPIETGLVQIACSTDTLYEQLYHKMESKVEK
jgi:hypothetical protein